MLLVLPLRLGGMVQVVESGAKSMEIGVMRFEKSLALLEESAVAPIVASMEAEAEAETKRASADD